ncbi:MAG: AMP-binding protein [Hyphomicrobiales bacterium]|nr:AMP-binding protein [Hyphomicrobiales bacterium]
MEPTDPRPAESSLTDLLAGLPAAATALWCGESTWTFGDLDRAVRRAAAGLRALGIGPGDRVALWLPNTPEWYVLFLALARLGAVAVAVNTRFRSHEVQDIVGRSGCKALVLWPGFRGIDFPAILAGVDPAALGALEHAVVVGGGAAAVGLDVATVAYEALLDHPPLDQAVGGAGDGVVLFTTSGTTSAPKFVCHRQGAIVHHGRDVAADFGLDGDGDGEGVLQVLPLCGVFGFTLAMAALAAGRPMAIQPAFDGAAAAAMIHRHRLTVSVGTDDMVQALLDAVPGDDPFPSLRFMGYAAFNPALEDIAARAGERGVRLCGLYGMSEVHALYARQHEDAPLAERVKPGGRPVSPLAAARVCDPDTGEVLEPGVKGELQLKGPSLMVEYWGNPAATAAAFTADGFLKTGDFATMEPDGRFHYLGRMGDVLRLGGFLTSPLEIEEYLMTAPGVAACQVVGGERDGKPVAVAFVIGEPGAALDEAALTAHCRAGLAGYKVPARVFVVDRFPTTDGPNGVKIQRAELRRMAAEGMAAGAK